MGGFTKMVDGFVDRFLTKEGESTEEAKTRMAHEQQEREEATKARIAQSQAAAQASAERSRKAGKQD